MELGPGSTSGFAQDIQITSGVPGSAAAMLSPLEGLMEP